MIAVSTSWLKKDQSLNSFLDAVQDLGFHALELSVQIRRKHVRELGQQVRKRGMKITSVHNFCPAIEPIPADRTEFNAYLLCSTDDEERRKAVCHTKKTVDFAQEMGAKAVVLHSGEINVSDRARQLVKLFRPGNGVKSPEFLRLRSSVLDERKKAMKYAWEPMVRSLEEVNSYALKRKILMGLEVRYYINEVPNFEELETLFLRFPKETSIGYWHDTGHAHVHELFGLSKHMEFLRSFGTRLVGIHLHDAIGARDHRAPGQGEIDLGGVMSMLPPGVIRVIEVSSNVGLGDLKKGKKFLESLTFSG